MIQPRKRDVGTVGHRVLDMRIDHHTVPSRLREPWIVHPSPADNRPRDIVEC